MGFMEGIPAQVINPGHPVTGQTHTEPGTKLRWLVHNASQEIHWLILTYGSAPEKSAGCGGPTSVWFSDPFGHIVATMLLKQSKNHPRIDTRLAPGISAAQTHWRCQTMQFECRSGIADQSIGRDEIPELDV